MLDKQNLKYLLVFERSRYTERSNQKITKNNIHKRKTERKKKRITKIESIQKKKKRS
jgi:hypothetical protein